MKKQQANIDIIRHILRYCNDIDELIARFGRDYDTFVNDRAYFNAASMCILQIGELAKHLSSDYIEATKDAMPWQAMKSMRNLFAHNYMEMSKEIIWSTATEDIPPVKAFCEEQIKISELLSASAQEPEPEEDLEL